MQKAFNNYARHVPFVMAGRDGSTAYAEFFVLCRDDADQVACYRAIVDVHEVAPEVDRGPLCDVTMYRGEKLGYSRALAAFPNLVRSEYRD